MSILSYFNHKPSLMRCHYRVMLAKNEETGNLSAIKMMKHGTSKAQKQVESLFRAEVDALKELDHEHVCKLVGHSDKEVVTNVYGNDVKISYIAMEYVQNGELFDYIAETTQFNEQEARYYFKQIIETLEYLHSEGYAHRDIKPENLLLDEKFDLKFADFGFATKNEVSDTRRGTTGYMSPEVLGGYEYNCRQADLFSAAIILFIMIAQHCPFVKASKDDKYYKKLFANKIEDFW